MTEKIALGNVDRAYRSSMTFPAGPILPTTALPREHSTPSIVYDATANGGVEQVGPSGRMTREDAFHWAEEILDADYPRETLVRRIALSLLDVQQQTEMLLARAAAPPEIQVDWDMALTGGLYRKAMAEYLEWKPKRVTGSSPEGATGNAGSTAQIPVDGHMPGPGGMYRTGAQDNWR